MHVFVWLIRADLFLSTSDHVPLKNQIGGFCHGGNVMFRVNSDGKNYLAIYWYLTHFFAENHVISHVIIFLAEANELIQSLGGCFKTFHKIIW